jgi:hypothetical protein
MATKAEMVKARIGAYNLGYTKADSSKNPYKVGTASGTWDAYMCGVDDAFYKRPSNASKVNDKIIFGSMPIHNTKAG